MLVPISKWRSNSGDIKGNIIVQRRIAKEAPALTPNDSFVRSAKVHSMRSRITRNRRRVTNSMHSRRRRTAPVTLSQLVSRYERVCVAYKEVDYERVK